MFFYGQSPSVHGLMLVLRKGFHGFELDIPQSCTSHRTNVNWIGGLEYDINRDRPGDV